MVNSTCNKCDTTKVFQNGTCSDSCDEGTYNSLYLTGNAPNCPEYMLADWETKSTYDFIGMNNYYGWIVDDIYTFNGSSNSFVNSDIGDHEFARFDVNLNDANLPKLVGTIFF